MATDPRFDSLALECRIFLEGLDKKHRNDPSFRVLNLEFRAFGSEFAMEIEGPKRREAREHADLRNELLLKARR